MTAGDYKQSYLENLEVIPISERAALYINPTLERERLARAFPLLSRYGRRYTNVPNGHDALWLSSVPADVAAGRCYDAAYYLASIAEHDLTYCEGFCFFDTEKRGVTSLAHAWTVDAQARVVDPSLARSAQCVALYVGVPFQLPYVRSFSEQTGYVGLLDGVRGGKRYGVYHDDASLWLKR